MTWNCLGPLMTGKNGETPEELGPFEGQARLGLLDSTDQQRELKGHLLEGQVGATHGHFLILAPLLCLMAIGTRCEVTVPGCQKPRASSPPGTASQNQSGAMALAFRDSKSRASWPTSPEH